MSSGYHHLNPGKLVLIAFGDIDGDGDHFLIRRQNFAAVNIETRGQILAAQVSGRPPASVSGIYDRRRRSTTALRHATGNEMK